MKTKTVNLIVLANLAALMVLAIVAPHLMVSPGGLIDGHAELATDCFACHSPFVGSTPAKCVRCHEVAQIGLRTTTGLPIADEKKNVAFHRELIEEDCVACHSDHKGVKAFRPISRFSHELLQTATQEQCDGCHADPSDSLHRMISGNCGGCHARDRWVPATFDHDRYFRFDRDHVTDCVTCHVNNDYKNYTCYGCHEHSRSGIRREHVEEGIREYEDCVACHRSGDEDEAEHRWRSRRARTGPAQRHTYRYEYRHDKYEDDDEHDEHEDHDDDDDDD